MKKLKLYITSSIDGYIATPDGDLEWLVGYPRPSAEDYTAFFDSVDTVIMGGNTYHTMRYMDILWPYQDKPVYVVTRNPLDEKENVTFITDDIVEAVSRLKEENGKDIWLVGGAQLADLLQEHNLIDEIIVTQIPIKLDSGTPLFKEQPENLGWVLKEEVSFGNDAVKKTYLQA